MSRTVIFFSKLLLCLLVQGHLAATGWNVVTAKNSNGDTASVFQSYNGIDFDLSLVTISNAGVKSGTTVLGNSATMDSNPLVAINNLGNIVVIWTAVDFMLGVNALYMNYYDGISWQVSSIQISDNDENVFNNYNLEFTDSDWVVITWSSYSQTALDNVVRAVYGTLGSLSAPDTLS
jgi:hypothetical protein